MSQQCSWPTHSRPLEGRCPYNALIGLTQAPGSAGGPDFCQRPGACAQTKTWSQSLLCDHEGYCKRIDAAAIRPAPLTQSRPGTAGWIWKGGARERAEDVFFCHGHKKTSEQSGLCSDVVPVAGLEPARHRWRWILSPLRLPIPSHRRRTENIIQEVLPEGKGYFQTKYTSFLGFWSIHFQGHVI